MFKNYFLLSLKVLKRKPLYTFISLFGISFTLMILMLLTSMFDATLGTNQPMTHRDRIVVLPFSERTRTETDTILKIDTIQLENGLVRYDSTETYENDVVSTSNGPMSYGFVDQNLRKLESAEKMAYYSDGFHIDGYLDGQKFSFASYYTSASYWEVLDFDFLYGGPFLQADEDQANKVVVLTDKAAREYFGELSSAVIGREMILGKETFKVKGVVKRPLADSPAFAGDIYLPATTADARVIDGKEIGGSFSALFLAPTPEKREALIKEITFVGENFQMPPDEYHDKLTLFGATVFEAYASGVVQERDSQKALRLLFIPVVLLLMLFVALPLLNLINLNISRVQERKSEIGVRKAFGANSRDILLQFIFENLVLTFIGGFIGMLLAVGMISYINKHDLLGITRLSYSYQVFFYFLVVIIVFGFLSGILPAYRMSRANVAESLR